MSISNIIPIIKVKIITIITIMTSTTSTTSITSINTTPLHSPIGSRISSLSSLFVPASFRASLSFLAVVVVVAVYECVSIS